MKNKFIVLFAVAILLVVIQSAPSAFGEMTSKELNAHIREQIEKEKKEKEKQHPKIESRLTEVEDAYKKDGAEAAVKIAKEKGLNIKDNKIRVHIVLKPGLPAETFDAAVLESYGVDIIQKVADTLVADVPSNNFREVADKVDAIIFITQPTEPEALSYESQGVSKPKLNR